MNATTWVSIGLVGLLLGCKGGKPVDLVSGGEPGLRAAIVREADDCWLRAVDGRAVPSRGMFESYRSYRIAGGQHTLTVEYEQTGTTGDWRSGPMQIPLALEPDHTYVMKSNRSGVFFSMAGGTSGAVKPTIIDEASKQVVGTVQDNR